MAENKILKMCRLLGDSTRLRIYEMVKARPMGITVKEVAVEVNLHPNVARLHLSKLEKEALVTSRSLPSRSKGRPQRLYLPGNATVSISVPERNYSLLCRLLLQLLGNEADVQDRAHQLGVLFGRQTVAQEGSNGEPGQVIIRALASLGFEPILSGSRPDQVEIQTGNCIFREAVALNPSIVCRLHHAITEGIASEALGAETSVSLGNYRCRQVIRMQDA